MEGPPDSLAVSETPGSGARHRSSAQPPSAPHSLSCSISGSRLLTHHGGFSTFRAEEDGLQKGEELQLRREVRETEGYGMDDEDGNRSDFGSEDSAALRCF